MPLKKSEDKISATRGVTPRVKAARRPAAPPVAVAATVAKAKSASPKAAKAPKPVPAATASLLNLNGAVNGPVTSAQIAERAYFLWLEKGCPEGTADQDWVEAERQLSAH